MKHLTFLAIVAPAFLVATAAARTAPDCPELPEARDDASAAEVARAIDLLASPSVNLGPACAEARRFAIDLVDRALAIGDFDRAVALCDRLAAGGTPREGRVPCARARVVVGDLRIASDLMEECIRDAGDDRTARVRALVAAARVFEERYRFDTAAGFLGRAVVESPDDRDLALRWVDALLEAGRADQAGTAASEVVTRRPELLRDLARRLVLRGATSHAKGLADALARTGVREDLDTAVSIHMGNKDPAAAKAIVKSFVAAGDPAARLDRTRAGAGVLARHGMPGDGADLLSGELGPPASAVADDLELLGRLLLGAARIERAEKVLDAAFEKSGKTVTSALRIADLWARAQQPRRAAAVLQRVETASIAEAVDMTLRAGRYLREAGDPKAEDAWYREVASRIADPGALWQGIGEAMTRVGEVGRALLAFDAAESAALDARRVALARIGRAEALLGKGRAGHESAERALRLALEGAAEDPDLVARIEAAARRIPGSSALSRGVLEASLRRDPSRHDQWLLLGEVEIADQRADAAFHAFCRAIDTATDRSQALSDAIDRLVEGGMATSAIRLLKARADGVRPSPKQAERLARVCLRLGEGECAHRHAGEFLEGPLDTEYDYVSLARELADAGRFDRADQALSAAGKQRPPSDAWGVSLERGRLEVLRGRPDRAESWFERAAEEGTPEEVAMHVARTWRAVGDMTRAGTWYERAAAAGDAVAVLPELLDAHGRAGRIAEVAPRVEAVPHDAWRSARRVIPVAASLVTMGLGRAARELIEAVFDSMPLSERPGLEPLRVLLALGSEREVLEEARRGCVGAKGPGGRSCELLASGLIARGLGSAALSVLDAVLAGRPDAHSARILRAEVLVRMGDGPAAFEAAMGLAAEPSLPDEVRDRLVRLFARQRHPKEASRIVEALFARGEGAAGDGLVRESVRLLLANGQVETAVARLETWAATAAHRRFVAYRLLVRGGFRNEAVHFLRDLDVHGIEDVEPETLSTVLSDLLEHGERAAVDALVDRIEREGSLSARAVMGSALGSMGWRCRAVRLLSDIPLGDRSTEVSLTLADLLAKRGDIDGALAAVEAAVAGPVSIRPEVRETMARSLLIEGASVERAAAIAATAVGKEGDPGATIRRAILLAAGSVASLEEARRIFLREALSQAELPAVAAEYIRTEARRGSLTGLLAAIEVHPGLPARQASLHAACLLRDARAVTRARERIEALDGPAGHGARLAAARAWFECGEWNEARAAAETALERMAPDRDPREAAVLAVIAGRMAGKDRHSNILRHLHERTDDRLVRTEQEASVHLARGDVAAAARAMEARAARTPGDERAWVAVARLAVQAGDEGLRSRAQERALGMPIDMGTTLQGFEDGYRAALRDDLAATVLDLLAGWYPADAAVADRRFLAALGGGDDARAVETAMRILDLAGDRRAAATFVVGRGASMLSVPVVDRFLDEVLRGGPDAAAARAVLNAGVLRFRIGDDAGGFALIERAAGLANDPAGFVSSVGRAALVDPAVPPDAVDRAVAALRRVDFDPASLANLPTAFAATCLGRGAAADVEDCAAHLDRSGFHPIPLLIGGAKRAFATHRYDVAEAALQAAARRDPSRIFGRMLAVEILEAVGDRFEVRDLAVRERLGAFALGRIGWRGAVADPETVSLVAQLTEMVKGSASARALVERNLFIDPTNASGWNGLAYLLSMAGEDLPEALRFVRKAEILEPSQNGYFLETEGWTWFRKGDAGRALGPQLAASRLWTGDLGTALAESLHHLGRILEAVGRREEAATAYRQAFIRGPETTHGHRALARWRLLVAPDGDQALSIRSGPAAAGAPGWALRRGAPKRQSRFFSGTVRIQAPDPSCA